jgi:hypothetical protein
MIKNYILPVLVLLSGIFISVISAYYSILGLVSIFSGATLLIMLMGSSLEIGKIISCLWLHKHWNDRIGFLKVYLSIAIIVLMGITSLGIYGFLTKANLKQSEGVNLNLSKVASLENNINREQSRLDLNNAQILQYNELLSKLTTQDVRRASNERRRIQSEIKVLSKESKEISKTVDNLNTELLPYKSEINAVEVEVGTLLYISKLIYGDDYKEHLPQTLTALTLLIIFVFDPLAIGLLIASQKSFGLIPKKDVNSTVNSNIASSWEDFRMSDGGSSDDIRNRVDEIQKQVQIDKDVYSKVDNSNADTQSREDFGIKTFKEVYDEVVNNYKKNPIRKATDEEEEYIRTKNGKKSEAEVLLNIGYQGHMQDARTERVNQLLTDLQSTSNNSSILSDTNYLDSINNTDKSIDECYEDIGMQDGDVKVVGRLPKRRRQMGKKI